MKLVIFVAAVAGVLSALGKLPADAKTTIPAGVPLRIQVDHSYRVRPGTRIEGHLISPVDSVDHKVLLADKRASGVIARTRPAPQKDLVRSFLDGNFVPARVQEIRFDALHLPDGTTAKIETAVVQRDATVVKMTVNKRRSSLKQMARQERRWALFLLVINAGTFPMVNICASEQSAKRFLHYSGLRFPRSLARFIRCGRALHFNPGKRQFIAGNRADLVLRFRRTPLGFKLSRHVLRTRLAHLHF